ncbi:hypothetical protein BYT27DRAFT_7184235, partial [Phlegmacium glaucopus]
DFGFAARYSNESDALYERKFFFIPSTKNLQCYAMGRVPHACTIRLGFLKSNLISSELLDVVDDEMQILQ